MRWIKPALWIGVPLGAMTLAWAIAHPGLQEFVESSGVNIPTDDVVGDYTWGIVWACFLMVSILAWPVRWEHKRMLAAGWLVKCFVDLVVMLPYEQRYWGADCWGYFQRAHSGLAELTPRALNGSSDLIIWLGALHLKIAPDSYHAMKISFAMFGFVAIYFFYLSAEVLVGRFAPLIFWGLTFYPSILFWSSILGKDPVILAAIALHVWGMVKVMVHGRNGYLFAVLAGIGAASAVRIWMGPILLVPCLLILGARIKRLTWRIAAVVLLGLALATLGPATADRLQLAKASDILEVTRNVSRGWEANSGLRMESEPNSLLDLALFTPQSMFIAYFRPLPGDVANIFGWLAGLENLGLLAFFLWALFRLRPVYFRNHLFLWGAALMLCWGLAYSVVAYKDLGTAVRFKTQILPVLLGMIGFLVRRPSQIA